VKFPFLRELLFFILHCHLGLGLVEVIWVRSVSFYHDLLLYGYFLFPCCFGRHRISKHGAPVKSKYLFFLAFFSDISFSLLHFPSLSQILAAAMNENQQRKGTEEQTSERSG